MQRRFFREVAIKTEKLVGNLNVDRDFVLTKICDEIRPRESYMRRESGVYNAIIFYGKRVQYVLRLHDIGY